MSADPAENEDDRTAEGRHVLEQQGLLLLVHVPVSALPEVLEGRVLDQHQLPLGRDGRTTRLRGRGRRGVGNGAQLQRREL